MSTKLEQAFHYICDTQVGTKLSIKKIAEELSISEGTAYQAIRQAEQKGLVISVPKAGTTRIEQKAKTPLSSLTLSRLLHLVNASTTYIGDIPDFPISGFCLGDSSPEDLSASLKGKHNMVCILGDRPELQLEALSLGAHLLLTGGHDPSPSVLDAAVNQNVFILQTKLSTPYALDLINHSAERPFSSCTSSCAKVWMQKGLYLFQDDLIVDACRMFSQTLAHYIPVVDHNMQIFGMLYVVDAYHADPVQRVDRVCMVGAEYTAIQEDDRISTAKHLFPDLRTPALVMNGDRLSGVLTIAELLSCYQHQDLTNASDSSPLHLQMISSECSETETRRIYRWKPGSAPSLTPKEFLSQMLTLAHQRLREQTLTGNIQNINFYTLNSLNPSEVTILLRETAPTAAQRILEFQFSSQECHIAHGMLSLCIQESSNQTDTV